MGVTTATTVAAITSVTSITTAVATVAPSAFVTAISIAAIMGALYNAALGWV